MFIRRDDFVFHGRFDGGSVGVVVFGDGFGGSGSLQERVVSQLVNTKVNSKRVQQVDFILQNFAIVKGLEDHVVVHLLWRWNLERLSCLV